MHMNIFVRVYVFCIPDHGTAIVQVKSLLLSSILLPPFSSKLFSLLLFSGVYKGGHAVDIESLAGLAKVASWSVFFLT